jgi:hypothetical protein
MAGVLRKAPGTFRIGVACGNDMMAGYRVTAYSFLRRHDLLGPESRLSGGGEDVAIAIGACAGAKPIDVGFRGCESGSRCAVAITDATQGVCRPRDRVRLD